MGELQINLPEETQKTNFRGLDGLRAVSILIVITSHVLTPFPVYNNFGLIGVYTFFVISGFLITTLLLKERLKYGNISLKGFYIRRCFRILPVAYLFLIVLIGLNIIYKMGIPGKSFLACFLFIKHLPVLENFNWHTGHFWSLGVEEQFYLLFPFLIVALPLRNYKRLIQCLIVLIPILSFIYVNKLETHSIHIPQPFYLVISLFYNLLGRGTVLILIGSLFSILWLTQHRLIKLVYKKAPPISSFLLFFAGSVLVIPVFPWYVRFFSEATFGILIAFAIILNLKERSYFSRLLEVDIMKKIGILSYSIYIWQQIFTYKQPWFNAGNNVILIGVNLVALILVSILSYSLYEKKFLTYKNRFKRV